MLQCGEGNSRADFIAPLREACEAPERANEQIPTGTGTALHYCTCASSETLLPYHQPAPAPVPPGPGPGPAQYFLK